jgi:2-aminoadipate transaminase
MTVTAAPTWAHRFARRTRSGGGGALAAILALSGRKDIISFSGGLPDPATLPKEILADILRDITIASDSTAVQYAPVKGLSSTLEFVAERLLSHEGTRPSEAELMITSGCVEALELLGKSLLDAGDTVIVEAPTYMGAFMSFRNYETGVVAVPMDVDGMRTDVLREAMVTAPTPKLLYTIPDFQNPTGLSLMGRRREEVVALAREFGVLVVEDVTYRDLSYGAARQPSLWSIGPDVVVQIGTFSKTFFPGVRLGWAAGPEEVIAQMTLAKQTSDQCAGALGQRLLVEYGHRGLLDQQIARAQTFYRRRRDLLMDALETHMPQGVSWTTPGGGFVTWVTVPERVDTDDLAEQAMQEAVAFVPGSVFYPDSRQGRNELRLSFSGVQDDDIDPGIRRLGALLWRALRDSTGGTA